ncbi:MAG: alanine racemase [Actinomycetota bacterium]|jgi:alanine racemase|nr:alanine racemase [Actinomycetota bacterium]
MTAAHLRPAWAEVDLGVIAANTAELVRLCTPALVCAVVKANGYGHGSVEVARAALAGGAAWLGVALVEEGVTLREAGVTAPILLLSEPAAEAMPEALAHDLRLSLYTELGAAAAAEAAADTGQGRVPVHVKVDTGMHRVGASADDAVDLAVRVAENPVLHLEGFWTHLAVADEPEQSEVTKLQLERFESARSLLADRGVTPDLLHTANTGGATAFVEARYDLVRTGIGIYGYPASPSLAGRVALTPAMALKAEVSFVKVLDAGERISYGLRYAMPERGRVATVPLGYADGVPRRLSACGGEVLIRGRRLPLAGTVTMDQVMVDCGDAPIERGDEVVFIGAQGDEVITAEDWARLTDTISYEIVCGIGPRVPRRYVGG